MPRFVHRLASHETEIVRQSGLGIALMFAVVLAAGIALVIAGLT